MENISSMVDAMERPATPDRAGGLEAFEVCKTCVVCEDPDLADYCALAFVQVGATNSRAATDKASRRRAAVQSEVAGKRPQAAGASRSP